MLCALLADKSAKLKNKWPRGHRFLLGLVTLSLKGKVRFCISQDWISLKAPSMMHSFASQNEHLLNDSNYPLHIRITESKKF